MKLGDSVYCQRLAWSGEVIDVLYDDEGEPYLALTHSHEPEDPMRWICVPLKGQHSEMFKTRLN